MSSLCKTQQPLNLFESQVCKFDYTKNQWWIQKYALIIMSNQRYIHPLRSKILLSFIVLFLKKIIYEWNKSADFETLKEVYVTYER
jgi:hypothetical protein